MKLKEIDIKISVCCFDDIINSAKINFSNILLDKNLFKNLYKNISVYNNWYKIPTGPKPIRFDKIDGFIKFVDGKIKYLILFGYWLFNKVGDKVKYLKIKKVVLQIVLIIILERSELIHMVLYLLKTYWLFIML